MELKAMTREDLEREVGPWKSNRHYGVKQQVVIEFLNSGAEVAEVKNCGQEPDNFQVGILTAARRLHANCRCIIRRGRLFMVRLPEEE